MKLKLPEHVYGGWRCVLVPEAFTRKHYEAHAARHWRCMCTQEHTGPSSRTAEQRQHHPDEFTVQKTVAKAVGDVEVLELATGHAILHSPAAHLVAVGYNILAAQRRLHFHRVRNRDEDAGLCESRVTCLCRRSTVLIPCWRRQSFRTTGTADKLDSRGNLMWRPFGRSPAPFMCVLEKR